MLKVKDIRDDFADLLEDKDFCGNGTIEILNAQFIADEPTIFGKLNKSYAERELEWYTSMSLNVNDIPGNIPEIWKQVSSVDGEINSNYGWCIFSSDNYSQFMNAVNQLRKDKFSRQATMIYNRPTMHKDAVRNGMSDFMCTYSVQLFIRKNKLHYSVYMRSNDAVFGYKNDKYWHDYVFTYALASLRAIYPDLEKGDMVWHAASLHVYPRHFHLIKGE